MQLYLKLRAGLLCCSYSYFLWATVGNVLLTKPAIAQQTTPTSTSEVQASAKAPLGILESLAAGENQELIVIYDDTKIQEEASNLRRQKFLSQDNPQVLAFKVAQYAKRKQQVLAKVGISGIQVIKDYSHLPLSFVRFQSKAALIRFLASSDVVRVYKNELRQHSLTQSLPLIGQPSVATAGSIGSGTTVAVLDSGVDYTRSVFGSCTSTTQPSGCKVVYAQDFATNDNQLDDDGHGTNVAGIIARVAPGTKIAALDVFRPRGGRDADIIAAINWSIQNKSVYNIVAMNLSLGSSSNNSSTCSGSVYSKPFTNARAAGIIPVVASGNDGYTNGIAEPACATGAVSVGAVYDSNVGSRAWSTCTDISTAADKVTCFSNSANILTILAPGSLIDAAGIQQSGTSQATPHVAGAVAVLRALFPTDTVDRTIARMTTTGMPVTDARNGIVKPRLNLLAATGSTIFWRHDDGWLSAWFMGETNLIRSAYLNPNQVADTVWKPVGTGDFNNDGKTDILWRHDTTGYLVLWFMDGTTLTSSTYLNPDRVADTSWKPVGTGDFNNDGKTDILWRQDTTGYLVVWFMDGGTLIGSTYLNPDRVADTAWKLVGTDDFNNDGKTDILWQHDTGYLSMWFMDGTTLTSSAYLDSNQVTDATWKPVGTSDFNNDGKTDILWRQNTTGYLVVWFMDRGTLIGSTYLNPDRVVDTGWKPIGAP